MVSKWIEIENIYPFPFPVGFILLHLFLEKVNFNFGSSPENCHFRTALGEKVFYMIARGSVSGRLIKKYPAGQKVLAKENCLGYKPYLETKCRGSSVGRAGD
jgi:hypothetical protein